MADYTQLAGILKDPKFAGKTDEEASAMLQVEDISVTEFTVSALDIFEAVDDGEFASLSDAKKARVRDIFSLGEGISVVNSRVKTVLFNAFGSATATRVALVALKPPDISQAQASGLGPRRTRESDVFKARAL